MPAEEHCRKAMEKFRAAAALRKRDPGSRTARIWMNEGKQEYAICMEEKRRAKRA